MELPSHLFCVEVSRADPRPRGRSLRYSVMVYLGLLRAERAGYGHDLDLEAISAALAGSVDEEELRPGDLGLYLWADALTGRTLRNDLLGRLSLRLAAHGGLSGCIGMELAWIIQGLALGSEDSGGQERELLAKALDLLLERNRAASGLFYHSASGGLRRRLPNFATEIYSILALATAARLRVDERALPAAMSAADRLLSHQLPDGGWPWLFDAEGDRVVERYELYSVHQHAMGPMGLLQLAEASGEQRYTEAAVRGLAWIHGRNELGLDMIDRENQMILRSLRRRRWSSRSCLYANTVGALALGRPLCGAAARPELNATCRPYELGWLLEAWCGRETVWAERIGRYCLTEQG
jgi:hypothetical protein